MKYTIIIIISLFLFSCRAPDKLVLKRAQFSELAGWDLDHKNNALKAFRRSCKNVSNSKKNVVYNPLFNLEKLEKICKRASTQDANEFFEENFDPYLAMNNSQEEGLFTGYYEISIRGSRKKEGAYIYPIYKTPHDLEDIKENLTRENIADGALEDLGLEIAYTDDQVRLFLMHVQGSGVLYLENGNRIKLGYHSQNGHKYTSIGKYLVEEKGLDLESMSAQTIVDWLEDNSSEAHDTLNKNESFVFFREYQEDGPIGSHKVALIPERSIAIDNNFIPYGLPIWLEAEYPDGESLNKLMVAQDSGGAINGPVRGDIFFGSTKLAEQLAWYMNARGKYFVLIPR